MAHNPNDKFWMTFSFSSTVFSDRSYAVASIAKQKQDYNGTDSTLQVAAHGSKTHTGLWWMKSLPVYVQHARQSAGAAHLAVHWSRTRHEFGQSLQSWDVPSRLFALQLQSTENRSIT